MTGRGRPTKRAGVGLDGVLKVRMAKDTLGSIRRLAAGRSMAVSDWVREVLSRAVRMG